MSGPALIVVADDYGRSRRYDAGILAAAEAGAIDAASVMIERDCELERLAASGVAIGLHLELDGWSGEPGARRRARPADREEALRLLAAQLDRFERLLGRPPAHLDGHHHCHAAPGLGAAIARAAAELALPLRSVSPAHRRTLRCLGAPTPDRLVGRLAESAPALPAELAPLVAGSGGLPPGVSEWMVHPGYRDPGAGSAYDRGREEDLELLLELAARAEIRCVRATHAAALA